MKNMRTHVRSAYIIKSGNGSQTAHGRFLFQMRTIRAYYWVYKPDELRRGGRREEQRPFRGDAEYHFKVRYDGDEENARLQSAERVEYSWNILFSEDTVEVVLGDDSVTISNCRCKNSKR